VDIGEVLKETGGRTPVANRNPPHPTSVPNWNFKLKKGTPKA